MLTKTVEIILYALDGKEEYLVQIPSSLHWSDQIIPALDYGGRNMANTVYLVDQLPILLEPATMDKVVTAQFKILNIIIMS